MASRKSKRAEQPLDAIFSETIMDEITKASNLVKRLRLLHEKLSALDQDERPAGIDAVAAALVAKRVTHHKSKDIRVLSACCLADILRVYAPEAPFKPDELLSTFELFIKQLHALSNPHDPSFQRVFYILESLATVKSCVLLCEMAQDAGLAPQMSRAEELLVELFRSILSSLGSDANHKLETYVLEVLTTCLEECEMISLQLLDTILINLLPAKREPRCYHVTQSLIRDSSSNMIKCISEFINGVINEGRGESELAGHVHSLIYELHKISPGMLLYILPTVCNELQAEEISTRLPVVKLLGKLFSAPEAEYAKQYQKNFIAFLGRFKDKEAAIRLKMVMFGGALLVRHPHTADVVIPLLSDRFLDPDPEVRQVTVVTVCDVLAEKPALTVPVLVDGVRDRMKDRKATIRKQAITGAAQVYCMLANREAEELDLFAWAPSAVAQCYGMPELEIKGRVLQIIDEVFVSKNGGALKRAEEFVRFFASLNEIGKKAINKMLIDRRAAQQHLAAFARASIAAKRERASKKKASLQAEVSQHILSLASLYPMPSAAAHLRKIAAMKDLRIFLLVQKLSDPCTPRSQLTPTRADLIGRLGSSAKHTVCMKGLIRLAWMATGDAASIPFIITAAQDYLNVRQTRNGTMAISLLQCLSEHFPSVFNDSSEQLAELVGVDHTGASEGILRVLCNLSGQSSVFDARFKRTVKKRLVDLCHNGTPEQAKLAMRVLHGMFDSNSSLFTELAEELYDALEPSSSQLTSLLRSLGVLAQLSPRAFEGQAQELIPFVLNQVILCAPKKVRSGSRTKPTPGAICRVAAIKMLANHVSTLGAEPQTVVSPADLEAFRARASPIIRLFASLLQSQGKTSKQAQPAPDTAVLRLAAAKALLKAMCNSRVSSLVTPDRWHALAFVARDIDPTVRSTFITRAHRIAMHQGNRVAVFVALGVTDPNKPIAQTARRLLRDLTQKFRRKYAHNIQQYERVRTTDPTLEGRLSQLMPEYMLPYLIHVLAHDPAFPTTAQGGYYPKQQVSLRVLIDELVKSRSTGNVSLLLQMLQAVRRCSDAVGDDSANLHLLSEIAGEIVKSTIKHERSVTPHPGSVYLPSSLFASCPREALESPISLSETGRESMLPEDFVLVKSPLKSPYKSPSAPRVARSKKTNTTPSHKKKRKKTKALAEERPTRITPRRSATKAGAYEEADSDIDQFVNSSEDESNQSRTLSFTSPAPGEAALAGSLPFDLSPNHFSISPIKAISSRASLGASRSSGDGDGESGSEEQDSERGQEGGEGLGDESSEPESSQEGGVAQNEAKNSAGEDDGCGKGESEDGDPGEGTDTSGENSSLLSPSEPSPSRKRKVGRGASKPSKRARPAKPSKRRARPAAARSSRRRTPPARRSTRLR